MPPVRILIVEDEILIADNIKRFLHKNGYEVVGIAISYEEAEKLYLEEKPDISLLDIRLNGLKTGIDFAHFLQGQSPTKPFIFLTSQIDHKHIQYAKDTFPDGYLSKPIDKESLLATIEIALHKHAAKSSEIPSIPLSDGSTNHIVPIKDILFLEAEHIYVKIHLVGDRKIVQRNSLKEILKQLPEEKFLQTHRSFAINIHRISHWDHQNLYIQHQAIPISRSRKKEVFSYLKSG